MGGKPTPHTRHSEAHFSRNYLTIQAQQISRNDQSVNSPLLEMWETALPIPLAIG